MKQVAKLVALSVLLSGCAQFDPEEIKQCENYISGKLKAPSTYKRIKADSIGIPFDKPKEWSVIIEYDAANAYGTPLRDKQICIFPIKDGKADTSRYIDFDVKLAEQASKLELSGDNLTAQ